MDVDELIAREAIRDLVNRYNSTADSGRFDETVDLFAPDAVMETLDETHDGRDAIRAMFEGVKGSFATFAGDATRYMRHFTWTLQIDVVSATTARSRCYYQVLMPQGLDHWGRYIDEFAVDDGRWVFSRRRVTVDGQAANGWAAARATP